MQWMVSQHGSYQLGHPCLLKRLTIGLKVFRNRIPFFYVHSVSRDFSNTHFQSYINDRNWNIFLSNLWESFCFDFIYNYNLFWSAAAPPLPPPGWCIRLAKSLCVRSLGSDLNWYDMFPFWSPCQASKFRLCARWSCSLERVLKFWNFEW